MLAKEGHGSIENAHGYLYSYDSLRFQRRPQQVLATQEYYYMARHFATNHAFATKYERIVWEMHAEAKPLMDIVRKINKVGYHNVWVADTINRLRAIMLGSSTPIKETNGHDKKC